MVCSAGAVNQSLYKHSGKTTTNFALYGDLSDRMMSLAAGLGPAQEIYSIDESFIDLTGVRGNLVDRCHKVRSRILQWVPVHQIEHARCQQAR